MNAKQLIAAVTVFAAAGSAFADVTGEFIDYVNIPSTRTRSEVVAELKQARTEGTYAQAGGEEFANQTNQYAGVSNTRSNNAVASTKTRAEVVAELKQARAEGYVVGGEEYVAPPAYARNGRTRDAVRNEAIATQRNKKVTTQESGS